MDVGKLVAVIGDEVRIGTMLEMCLIFVGGSVGAGPKGRLGPIQINIVGLILEHVPNYWEG